VLLNRSDIRDPALLVIVNNQYGKPGKETFYNAARFAWKVDIQKVIGRIILVSYYREIKEVLRVDEWLPAREICPDCTDELTDRFGFIGRRADEEIRRYYKDRRLGDDIRSYGQGFMYLP
jgi:hypothetical protein